MLDNAAYIDNSQTDHDIVSFQLMVMLKSLSNIGQLTPEFEEQLEEIIQDAKLDPKIRVAAVEVYRRLPCHEYRPYFEKLFRNIDVDVEVRIAAYLQVMRCPTYVTIRTIKHSLEIEEVNQGNVKVKTNKIKPFIFVLFHILLLRALSVSF